MQATMENPPRSRDENPYYRLYFVIYVHGKYVFISTMTFFRLDYHVLFGFWFGSRCQSPGASISVFPSGWSMIS